MTLSMSKLVIRPMLPIEAVEASSLVAEVFNEFVAPDLEPEGVEEFMRHSDAVAMQTRMTQDHFILVAELDSELAGMIDMSEHRHISLFFVSQKHQGRGVGKKLLKAAMDICLKQSDKPDAITVNSSLWATGVYQKLGFEPQKDEQCINGIRFVPMSKPL